MDTEFAASREREASIGGLVGAKQAVEPEINAARNEVAHLGKLVAEIRANVGTFVDRVLIGDAPTVTMAEGQERAQRSLNDGSTGQLRREIESATELAEDALRMANRLRQIG